jgi:hypothetical protein
MKTILPQSSSCSFSFHDVDDHDINFDLESLLRLPLL